MLHVVDSEKTFEIEEIDLFSSVLQYLFPHRLLLYSRPAELWIVQSRKSTSLVNGINSHRLLSNRRTEPMGKVEGCPGELG